MSTGYLSIADLPPATERTVITGTGQFQDIEFNGVILAALPEGPCLVTAQLYFYPVAGSVKPRGMIVQTQRSSNDPTADDSIVWPVDWPFSYLPKLYTALDFVKAGNLSRGIRINVPAGTKVALGSHILKVENATAEVASRVSYEAD